jgi:hypothetical protein
MTPCECCLSASRKTDTYAAQLLDGSRDTVVLCLKCRERFRRQATLGLETAPDAAGRTECDATHGSGHLRSHRAANANEAPTDWRRIVYGGRAAHR